MVDYLNRRPTGSTPSRSAANRRRSRTVNRHVDSIIRFASFGIAVLVFVLVFALFPIVAGIVGGIFYYYPSVPTAIFGWVVGVGGLILIFLMAVKASTSVYENVRDSTLRRLQDEGKLSKMFILVGGVVGLIGILFAIYLGIALIVLVGFFIAAAMLIGTGAVIGAA